MKQTLLTFLVGAATICLAGNAFAEGFDADRQSRAGAYSGIEPAAGDPKRMTAYETRTLQRELHKRGFSPGPIDGIIGPRTSKALRDFQRSSQLSITGTPTMETLDELGMNVSSADRQLMERSRAMPAERPVDEDDIQWNTPRRTINNEEGYRSDEMYMPQ